MSVRLSDEQIDGIGLALREHANANPLALYLYGSRTDANARGGDIDLLCVCENEKFREQLTSEKHKVLASIKQNIGDQKVDLLIVTSAQIQVDPFLRQIFPSAVLLFQQ